MLNPESHALLHKPECGGATSELTILDITLRASDGDGGDDDWLAYPQSALTISLDLEARNKHAVENLRDKGSRKILNKRTRDKDRIREDTLLFLTTPL